MKLKRFLKIRKNMSDFLKSGTYSFNRNLTQLIVDKNSNEIYDVSQTNIDKSRKKSLISYIYNIISKRKWKIQNRKGYFYGTRLLIPNNDTGFKVFDEYHVLTYYYDSNYKNKIVKNRNKMSFLFHTPKILESNQNYIIEEKISSQKIETDSFILYMCNRYVNFFRSNEIQIQQDLSDYKLKYRKLFPKFYFHFKDVPTKQTIFQHGDIWNGNILYDEHYYLIDFEICKERFYLYDFFFYLYSYIFIYDDYTYLDNYFNGNYDMILNEYCASLRVQYDTHSKGLYFKQFLLNFMEDRFQDYTIRLFYKESKKIITLFQKYHI